MELDDIFNKYESAVSAQEDARRQENERIIARRAVARESIEKCLREVVEPSLVNVRDQITARGYPCTVEYQQRVEDVNGTKITWRIGIYLETQVGKSVQTSRTPRLLFAGDVEKQGLFVEADYGRLSLPTDKIDPVPIGAVTPEFVSFHVRAFLVTIFKPPTL